MSRNTTPASAGERLPGRHDGGPSSASERSSGQQTRVGPTGGFPNVLDGSGPTPRADDSHSPRAQTSIDFVVGASVFLLTVAFVAAFLPGTFEPFTADGTEDALVADRTADLLAEQLLAPPTDPGVVEADCAAEFFDAEGDGADGLACEFDEDAANLGSALGVGSGTGVNVTVEENDSVQSVSHGGSTVSLAAGPTPPDDESVIVSRRVVLLDGEERDMYVRVW